MLRDHGHPRQPARALDGGQRTSVDEDLAAGGLEVARQDVHQGRFAAPGVPDQRRGGPARGHEVDPAQDGGLAVVAEVHVTELDLGAERLHRLRALGVGRGGRGVEELAQAPVGGERVLDAVVGHGHGLGGAIHEHHDPREGREAPGVQAPDVVNDQVAAA